MARRTTILLDAESHRAARQLAAALDVTPSEAIRRAIAAYREQVIGTGRHARRCRLRAFERAMALFERNDPEAEITALKAQDKSF